MRISKTEIENFEKRYKTTFVNSLSGFKSLFLIGTKSKDGISNLAIFNSVIHIGANPPLLGFINRPDRVDRHTLKNIMDSGVYTLNSVEESFYKKAHQTSARSQDSYSELVDSGLHEEYLDNCIAPFVKESNFKMEMKLIERIDLKSNGTHLIIGQIENVYLDKSFIAEDGFLNLEGLQIMTGSGLDAYHKTHLLERLPYAKANF